MRKTSKVNLCVIGGHNFGKTSLAVSLIKIADTTEGSVTVLGESAKLLAIKNRLLLNDGQLESTAWDEIRQFTFMLYGESGRSWEIKFHDYPGEYFEKYLAYRPATVSDRIWQLVMDMLHSTNRKNRTLDPLTFDAVTGLKATQLGKHLDNSDGLIVLLPADFNSAKYNDDRIIYKNKLGEFIAKVIKVNPQIPICLAVNKWDMLNRNPKEVNEVLTKEPFDVFYNMLQHHCANNLFTIAISAFGKHRADNVEKMANDGKPENVLEMFLELASRSENSRFHQFSESWGTATLWKKAFIFPFKALSFCRLGSNELSKRQSAKSISKKAWGLFSAALTSIVILIFLCFIGVESYKESVLLGELQERIALRDSNLPMVSKIDIENDQKFIGNNNLIRQTILLGKVEPLQIKMNKLEQKYNERIKANIDSFSKDPHLSDMKPWEILPDERVTRAKKRLSKIKDQKNNLTISSFINEFDKLIAVEEKLISNITQDKDFDIAIFNRLRKDKKDQCREIERIIEEFKDRFSYRQEDLALLQNNLDSIEQDFAKELDEKIKLIDIEQPNKDWGNQIKIAKKKIEIIQANNGLFAKNGIRLKNYNEVIANLNILISRESHYGPFDDDLGLLYKKPVSGKVREIEKFLLFHPFEKYPNRKEEIKKLQEEQNVLVEKLNQKRNDFVERLKDNKILPAVERINNAQELIKEYEGIRIEFSESSDEYSSIEESIKSTTAWTNTFQKYVKFEKDWEEVLLNSRDRQLIPIEKFLNLYAKSEYPEYEEKLLTYKKQFDEIRKEQIEKLKREIAENKSTNTKGSWGAKVNTATQCINKINSYRTIFTKRDFDWLDGLIEKENAEIVSITKQGKFDDALAEIETMPIEEKSKLIYEFMKNYKKEDYPNKSEGFDALENKKVTVENELKQKMEKEFVALKPETNDFNVAINYYQKKLSVYRKYLDYFHDNSTQKKSIQMAMQEVENNLEKYRKCESFKTSVDGLTKLVSQIDVKSQLSKVHEFETNNSSKEYPYVELSACHANIKSLKIEAETNLLRQIEKELTNIKVSIKAPKEEKLKGMQEEINIIKNYLPYFIKNSASYEKYNSRCTQLVLAFEAEEKMNNFNTQNEKLEIMLNNSNDPIGKIEKIELFEAQFQNDENIIILQRLKELSSIKNALYIKKDWYLLKEEMRSEKIMPDSSDVAVLNDFKKRCNEYLVEIKKFEKQSSLDSETRKEKTDFEDLKKKIEEKIGDGSFSGIQDAEKVYVNNPTEKNYEVLKNKFEAFDLKLPGNRIHEDAVKFIRDQSSLYNDLRIKFDSFREKKDYESLENFVECAKKAVLNKDLKSDYYMKYEKIIEYANKIDEISNAMVYFQITRIKFADTPFRSSWRDVDLEVEIGKTSDGNFVNIKIPDIKTNDIDFKVSDKDRKEIYFKSAKQDVEVTFKNTAGGEAVGKDKIFLAKILGETIDSGEVELEFSSKCENWGPANYEKDKEGKITIKFTGLPKLKK